MNSGRRLAASLAAALMSSGMLLAPGTAGAAEAQDEPTVRELLDQCEQKKTDSCVFHPSGQPEAHRGEYKVVGGATNCDGGRTTRVIRWESSETTTNSVGVTISASVELGKIFSVGFETSYQRQWSWTSSKADEVRHELQPHSAVNITAAPMREKVTGTYELHFPDKYKGHYIWYVRDVKVDGPQKDPAWDVRVEPTPAKC